jgi:endonuclease YncB( thermonuclease family)
MMQTLKQFTIVVAAIVFLAAFSAVRSHTLLIDPHYVTTNSEVSNGRTESGLPVVDHNGRYNVIQVTDGDTIVVEGDNNGTSTREIVRMLGIDTPEIEHPGESGQCFGAAAKQTVSNLLENRQVQLTTDPSQDMYDMYGRLLAYVSLTNSQDVGAYLLAEGFAREYTFRGRAYERQTEYRALAQEAQQEKKGLWGDCAN